jgi:hypothetical protein
LQERKARAEGNQGHGDSLSHCRFLSDGTAARRRGAQEAIHSSPSIDSAQSVVWCLLSSSRSSESKTMIHFIGK